MYGQSTLAHTPDSHFLGSSYSDVDNGRLKVTDDIVVQDKSEITFDMGSQDFGRNKNELATEEHFSYRSPNQHEVHDLEDKDSSGNARESVIEGSSTCYAPSSAVTLSYTETEFYTDKSVTECELPKLIVCFKEGHPHVVKDICIDEGLPSNNDSHESCEMQQKGLFACKSDVSSELTKDIVPTATTVSDGMDTSVECEHETDVTNKSESDRVLQNSEGKSDPRDGDLSAVPDEKANFEAIVSEQECTNGSKSHHEPSNPDRNEGHQQFEQDPCEEAQSVSSMVHCGADELNKVNQGSKLPVISEMDIGSLKYESDSLPPTTSGREETQYADRQKPVQTLKLLCHEEDIMDSQTASSRSFYIQHGHGESSFSSVGPLSGPIPYSGHVPYSGSISLRSDSSTTSTRSFAFPVMHTEWNSSPVKMAKADRRHLRKHRGWRTSLLCCRF